MLADACKIPVETSFCFYDSVSTHSTSTFTDTQRGKNARNIFTWRLLRYVLIDCNILRGIYVYFCCLHSRILFRVSKHSTITEK